MHREVKGVDYASETWDFILNKVLCKVLMHWSFHMAHIVSREKTVAINISIPLPLFLEMLLVLR